MRSHFVEIIYTDDRIKSFILCRNAKNVYPFGEYIIEGRNTNIFF